MKIMVAEYAVGAGVDEFMLEGRAMLETLVKSFTLCGHKVMYPTSGILLDAGMAVKTKNFEKAVEEISGQCDAGLVIAPDEMLGDLTDIVEENTTNLGCPADCVRVCADKLECTRILDQKNIPVPETIGSGEYTGDYIIKPRYGCASESMYLGSSGTLKDGYIATRFIQGEHLSVSLITGSTQLLLSVNRQFIEIDGRVFYKGGTVGYRCSREEEAAETAKMAVKALGCRGYVGVDMVQGDKVYVVDVNPRPTTSIIGIAKLIDAEIADLIIRSRFGGLPADVALKGSFTFKKEELSIL
jgi:predicted ATP-grasp superfamily ATP-dependent carboligase